MSETTTQAFFEAKYASASDPWSFATSEYEIARYKAIIAALGDRRYACAFEPGCSIGVLTALLSKHCDQVYAADISPTAVRHAQQRCQDVGNVQIVCDSLASTEVSGPFDLIILSEIGYYFEAEELQRLITQLVSKLSPHGTFLAAHWLGSSTEHILTGDHVHEIISSNDMLELQCSERHAGFRLDKWRLR